MSYKQFPLWQKTFQKLQLLESCASILSIFYLKITQNTEGVLFEFSKAEIAENNKFRFAIS